MNQDSPYLCKKNKMHDEIKSLLWKSDKDCPKILDVGCGNSGTIFCTYKYYHIIDCTTLILCYCMIWVKCIRPFNTSATEHSISY